MTNRKIHEIKKQSKKKKPKKMKRGGEAYKTKYGSQH
jgi:hypothetical protein